ncbi:MAG: c-type cytochrome domain-containing protein, partial [Verrucomicrobiota bacterium]|nr:c-type cytochrome domain-containing protein [Verrucomicrobiota bacterium]
MRKLILFLLIIGISNNETQAKSLDYAKDIVPLLEKYCVDCHSDDEAEADLNFDAFRTIDDLRRDTKSWIKVEKMLVS